MPETITREERLEAIVRLLPPRKYVEGRPQPYNSKAYNTIADLLDMVRADMNEIRQLRAQLGISQTALLTGSMSAEYPSGAG